MCILRYTPTTRPSASITAALLWYSPGARRSNTGAITTTPARCAAFARASVLGPGTGSARSNNAASSRCAKYSERNSSGRQTSRAPAAAASSTFATPCLRFASGSADMDIWTSPIVYLVGGCALFMGEKSTRFQPYAHGPRLKPRLGAARKRAEDATRNAASTAVPSRGFTRAHTGRLYTLRVVISILSHARTPCRRLHEAGPGPRSGCGSGSRLVGRSQRRRWPDDVRVARRGAGPASLRRDRRARACPRVRQAGGPHCRPPGGGRRRRQARVVGRIRLCGSRPRGPGHRRDAVSDRERVQAAHRHRRRAAVRAGEARPRYAGAALRPVVSRKGL